MSVNEWMDAARAGDREAFGQLYDHYRDTVFRFVRFRVGDRQVAEDLTAETFARALKRIDGFEWQGRDPGAWFVTIARNLVADYFKSARHQREVLTPDYLSTELDGHAVDGEDPLSVLLDAEEDSTRRWRCHDLRLEILRLPTDLQREAMLYRHVDGLPYAEVARLMDRGVPAVKALCGRAIESLHRTLVAS